MQVNNNIGSELPLVTIVTPSYNQAEFLEACISSVLMQDYPRIEYIVLNDGSTDHTATILEKYRERIRYENQSNMGQASTLNKGWSLASGSILGYLSSDDILHPWAVRLAVNELSNHPETVMVYPNCDLIDPNSRIIKKSVSKPTDYIALVRDQECHVGPGAFFRKETFNIVGGWNSDLKLAPDREFWMRMGLHGKFRMIPEVCAQYRMHPKSISYYATDLKAASEYIQVTQQFFNRSDIPSELFNQKDIAFSKAHVVAARIHLRGGRILNCLEEIKSAYQCDPKLNIAALIIMLIRTSISRSVYRVIWNLRQIFSKK
ncbi:glycosyltransferase family 2 protein [Paenibacillus periandrae]|uniref:glycosyltransferase family 2 protein n=1 Tax=Paenibacillus periandrae TaxID=1761741 RepID=UPI001F08BC78|nr:glycosyltransferase family 2 protein [Paenibacillus periandrae]